ADRVGVGDVEDVVAGVSGTERERQQPLLSPALHLAANVEERPRDAAAPDDLDRARLLDDVQRRRVAGRTAYVDRGVESGEERCERAVASHAVALSVPRGKPERGGDETEGAGHDA